MRSAKSLGLLTLVRAKMKDGSTMELTGRGTDAKSSITETPRSTPSPQDNVRVDVLRGSV